jgi:hypothetical protein
VKSISAFERGIGLLGTGSKIARSCIRSTASWLSALRFVLNVSDFPFSLEAGVISVRHFVYLCL